MILPRLRFEMVSLVALLATSACSNDSSSDATLTPESMCGAYCAKEASVNCAGFSQDNCRSKCLATEALTGDCSAKYLTAFQCLSEQPASAFTCTAGNVLPVGDPCANEGNLLTACLAELPVPAAADCRANCQRVYGDACPDAGKLGECKAACVLIVGAPCATQYDALSRCVSQVPVNQFDCSNASFGSNCAAETAAATACVKSAQP
jgi:hypothetical protein